MKTADLIILAVCTEHGISVEQIKQRGMYSKPIAAARGDAIRRLREAKFPVRWVANFLNMTTQGVSRHLYPQIQEGHRRACERYRARKAEAAVQQ